MRIKRDLRSENKMSSNNTSKNFSITYANYTANLSVLQDKVKFYYI